MYQVLNITDDAWQSQNLVLPDGTQIYLELYYRDLQQGWFINNLIYTPKNFTLQGTRITNSPNMLHQFRNLIPFGLYVTSIADREPSLIEDLTSGATTLYILSADEVNQYQEFLSGN